MNVNPLQVTVDNHDNKTINRIHARPISSRFNTLSQYTFNGHCGRGHCYKVIGKATGLAVGILASCIALAEAVASLAYATLATLVHMLSLGKSSSLQNHVIKSWAFCRHSFLMTLTPILLFANANKGSEYDIYLRTHFYKINCAHAAQSLGKVFNFFANRKGIDNVPAAKIAAIEVAIEGLNALINDTKHDMKFDSSHPIDPSSLPDFNQYEFIHFLRTFDNVKNLQLFNQHFSRLRMNDPSAKKFVETIVRAMIVYNSQRLQPQEPSNPQPNLPYSASGEKPNISAQPRSSVIEREIEPSVQNPVIGPSQKMENETEEQREILRKIQENAEQLRKDEEAARRVSEEWQQQVRQETLEELRRQRDEQQQQQPQNAPQPNQNVPANGNSQAQQPHNASRNPIPQAQQQPPQHPIQQIASIQQILQQNPGVQGFFNELLSQRIRDDLQNIGRQPQNLRANNQGQQNLRPNDQHDNVQQPHVPVNNVPNPNPVNANQPPRPPVNNPPQNNPIQNAGQPNPGKSLNQAKDPKEELKEKVKNYVAWPADADTKTLTELTREMKGALLAEILKSVEVVPNDIHTFDINQRIELLKKAQEKFREWRDQVKEYVIWPDDADQIGLIQLTRKIKEELKNEVRKYTAVLPHDIDTLSVGQLIDLVKKTYAQTDVFKKYYDDLNKFAANAAQEIIKNTDLLNMLRDDFDNDLADDAAQAISFGIIVGPICCYAQLKELLSIRKGQDCGCPDSIIITTKNMQRLKLIEDALVDLKKIEKKKEDMSDLNKLILKDPDFPYANAKQDIKNVFDKISDLANPLQYMTGLPKAITDAAKKATDEATKQAPNKVAKQAANEFDYSEFDDWNIESEEE